MKFKTILIFLFLLSTWVYPQKSSVQINIDGQTYLFPSVNKKGIDYISCKNLSEHLSAENLFNASARKMEIRFRNDVIKFTARNQFVIVTSRINNEQQIYQMAMPSLLAGSDILIPIQYCTGIIAKASGVKIKILKTIEDENEEAETVETETKKEKSKNDTKDEKKPEYKTKESLFDITGITLDVKANGTLIKIKSKKKIGSFSHSISKGTLYLNVVGLNVDEDKINSVDPAGLIKKIIAKNIQKNARIEFQLEEGYSTSEAMHVEKSNDLLITIHNKLLTEVTSTEKNKDRWKFDAVVIDAGHGGKDPGAIGINGTEEKKINLAIALKLGEMIEKNLKGVKVIYTRSSDKFVELYKRGKIANEKNGKLFISIHCNSTPQKPTNASGFEVYLLRPGRTREAINIASMENSVIKYEDNPKRYNELTDENFILVTMAHSSFMKYSEQFSDILNKEFSDKSSLKSDGIKQAGFYVLVGASMPSVLVESGYLSNKKDAAYLSGKNGQAEVAESIFSAVKKFKEEYDKEMKNKD